MPDADLLRELADACLEGMAEVARLEARAAAVKVRLAAEYAAAVAALAPLVASPQERTAQEMAVVAEVACVLTVSERSAGALLSDAQVLTTALPLTLGALEAGTISWQHARIMVDETANLDPVGAAGLEAHFLDPDVSDPARGFRAGELVPARFRVKARTWRERHHPVSIEKRHKKCAADRRVEFVPDRDGMAWLNAYLPADTAAGIFERTTAAARALQGPGEDRTLTQLRADVAATWLLTAGLDDSGTGCGRAGAGTSGGIAGPGAGRPAGNGGAGTGMSAETLSGAGGRTGLGGAGGCPSGGVPVPRAQVLVTVPVLSLLGLTEEPAMLDGYGPIPPSMARRLVADGADSFHRVLIDPRDGAPLEIGRTSYRVTKALRQWLRLRDGKCSFPGCNNPSLDNEADHLLAWADGGTTGISNLGQPCRKHHHLKHGSAWTPTKATKDEPPGWISPSGRTYPSEHQDLEPPHWPDRGIPPDPVWDHDPALPQDPFPEWYRFTAAHPPPAAQTGDRGWSASLADSYPDDLLLEYV
ncbi:DUF222 domain-containing protein [Arthrobacter sp. U41]|uniref:HNH endonuclease signature motif containing protein n=1 Tax=Arthrobacter sp. U41 TaxID=1849032 RepID=UPI0028D3222B|nr:DUF222 domain-containing protein [Arthrobacter sp. U41]